MIEIIIQILSGLLGGLVGGIIYLIYKIGFRETIILFKGLLPFRLEEE